MKTNKITFWITTGLIAAGFLMSAIMYFSHNPKVTEGFKALGYPAFMLYLLGTAKSIGAIGLLQPFSMRLREWSYAGSTILLIGATWSHLATDTPFVSPLIFIAILAMSWISNNKLILAKTQK